MLKVVLNTATASGTYIHLLICLAGWSGFEGKFIPSEYNFAQPFLMDLSMCRVKSICSGLRFGLGLISRNVQSPCLVRGGSVRLLG